jgi:hypothetical protein
MRPLVFVIMPVGSDPNYLLRRSRIAATVRALGMEPYFPLDHHAHNEVFDPATIRFEMQRARVAVADLTMERPSCYFELGIAQGVGLPTVIIAESGTPIHQTADRDQVAFYADFDELVKVLEDGLRQHAPSLVR